MSESIRVSGLSKKYRLGLTHSRSLRDLVNKFAHRVSGKKPESASTSGNEEAESSQAGLSVAAADNLREFWALRDVNFSVQQGDTVGIIGRNGAGKSTLLKILSNITTPTEGRAELHGRTASLLEVGTGFHPELTGRENVFLNATILGMTRTEVNRQFDAIVDFAGIENFVDTPVKRYSSGMKVRLGFAVAAHLEPEILIVDEVLAVGDMDFQRKCLGKMDDVAKSGRTILFVSHNMAAVSQLCRTGIVLQQGSSGGTMPIKEAIDLYLKQSAVSSQDGVFKIVPESNRIAISGVRISQNDIPTGCVVHNEDFDVHFELQTPISHPNLKLSIAICDRLHQKIFTAITDVKSGPEHAEQELTLRVRKRFLMPGNFSIIAGLIDSRMNILDVHRFVCPFQIANVGDDPLLSGNQDYGVVFGEHQWLQENG